MHVELLLAATLRDEDASAPRLAALELLLARGRKTRSAPCSLEQWLIRGFGLDGPRLPAGALTALAHGLDAGSGTWLRADPVHFVVRNAQLTLLPADHFDLSQPEADAIAASVAKHFALELHPVEAKRWCARASSPAAIECGSPEELAGRDVDASLPRGVDAKRWHATLNEVQMLLHEHPVNEAREQRGEPVVNSVWFWGAGSLPGAASAPWKSVSAGDPVVRGLARLAHIPTRAAGEMREGRHLELLEGPLRALEAHRFIALLEELRSGGIGMATLHLPEAGLSVETVRGDLRRFWRRPRPVASYAA